MLLCANAEKHQEKLTRRSKQDASSSPYLVIFSSSAFNSLSMCVLNCLKLSLVSDNLTKPLPAQKLQKSSAPSCEISTETAHPFRLCDLEEATKNFANRIGSGGFGIVYYGKLPDGREIAVKVPTNDSYQGKKQFTNEVL